MFFIAIFVIVLVVLTVVACLLYIETRAASQDEKYMAIRDNILALTK